MPIFNSVRASNVSFAVGDLLTLPAARYDAILCRGVLNDWIDDDDREQAFVTFGRALRPQGLLILDVREWEASAERKAREPLFRKSVDTDRGKLTFTSVTTVDTDNRLLLLSERHTVIDAAHERSAEYQFAMRCWTRAELAARLMKGGFGRTTYLGAYDATVAAGETDRLVAVAQLC